MKTILLLSVCVASITLSFGRSPSDTSRRSSQAEEVLTSLAAIKAATAKIEQCLAETSAMSSVNSDTASERSNSPTVEVSGEVGIQQAEVNALVQGVYTQAIAGLKDGQPLTLEKATMTEIAMLGKKIQLILNPAQAIADELAPYFLKISNSSEVTQLRNMMVAAALSAEALIKEHDKYLKSKIYKSQVEQLKEMQGTLSGSAAELMEGIVYDKAKSKEAPEGSYHISMIGQSLINSLSKEYAKLGLMRRYAVNDDGSLVVLDAQNPITQDSVEEDAVMYALDVLAKLGTNQLDLTLAGVVMDHMTLLKSGVHLASPSHKYYAVFGKKIFVTEVKDGQYSFNKKSTPAHILTGQELVTLTGSVNTLLKTALTNCKLKSPKFAPIRMMLAAKMDLTATTDAQASEGAQEATVESE